MGPEELSARRRELAKSVGRGVIALLGLTEKEGQSGFTGFRQDSNFYYLTGLDEPDVALVISPASHGHPYMEILFLPSESAETKKWTGPGPSSADALRLGFADVEDQARLPGIVRSLCSERGPLFGLSGQAGGHPPRTLPRLLEVAGGERPRGIERHLATLRSVKSEGEVALIKRAIAITSEAFRSALAVVRPGATEKSIAAELVAETFRRGCRRLAFPPIVASGANATILHYRRNEATLTPSQAVLVDAGAECSRYAADITRTVPVNGKFNRRQRQLYNLVLAAQDAAIKAARPGARVSGPDPKSVESAANRVLRKGAPEGVDPWLPHAIAHHVGLDVHDPDPPRDRLKAGMVLAIEPGLYVPEHGLGLRIEDIVEVRKDGARILSGGLPRSPDGVEALTGAG